MYVCSLCQPKSRLFPEEGNSLLFGCFYTAFWFLLLHWGGGGGGGGNAPPPHDFSPAAGFLFDECIVIFDEYLFLMNICVARLNLLS